MTLQQLEYIVAIEQNGSFQLASEKCFVTQPTLSMQVKKLEKELRIKIFERDTKPTRPTELGKLIIIKSKEILNESKNLLNFAKNEFNSLAGEFKIGIIPTLAPYLLPKIVNNISKDFPDTIFKFVELTTMAIIEQIKNDQIDIGILATPLDESKIREIPLFYERFYVFPSKNHKYYNLDNIELKHLSSDGLWLLQQGHCFRNQVLKICSFKNENKNVIYESGSIETLKNIIKSGSGYTLIPELSVDKEDKVIPFNGQLPAREISLIVKKLFVREKLIQKFRIFIQEKVNLPTENKYSLVNIK